VTKAMRLSIKISMQAKMKSSKAKSKCKVKNGKIVKTHNYLIYIKVKAMAILYK